MCVLDEIRYIVDGDFFPKVFVSVYKAGVNRINLVGIVTLYIIENRKQGERVGVVNHVTRFGGRRHSDSKVAKRFDFAQRTQTLQQTCPVFLRAWICQPEENVVN